jgi:hypothetical protein
MKATKTFDCLAMKQAIQAKLQKKWANLTTGEIQAALKRDLATSQSDLAKWWRKMEKAQKKDEERDKP